MAGGLVGLLDDIAALAKLAAASIDDIGAAAGKASMKAAGVVVDDTAVTPAYVKGLAANRELPIIKRIATGSLRNKIAFIIPVALILSAISTDLIEIILMFGGTFLAYEGAHKIYGAVTGHEEAHDVPAVAKGKEAEEETISGAIRTDFILSAEIMVISLKEVIDEPLISRALILVVVALIITAMVYGVVALIVKMDDIGLTMVQRDGSDSSVKLGRGLIKAMPVLLKWLSTIGIAAMLWVGGHILLVGANELGWGWPYDLVHDLENALGDSGAIQWIANTAASAVIGLVVGMAVFGIVTLLPFGKKAEH